MLSRFLRSASPAVPLQVIGLASIQSNDVETQPEEVALRPYNIFALLLEASASETEARVPWGIMENSDKWS